MSLLLDALKKAEKAKEDATRRSQMGEGADPDSTVLQVRTRNELPDISKPLEIHSEDVSSSPVPDAFSTAPATRTAQPATTEAPQESPPVAKARQPTASSAAFGDQQSAQRQAAKQVFEAKFREPNPKLPFYITMALLGAFALGTVVYFWYQLRPPPPLINRNPTPPADEKKLEPSAAAPAAASVQPSTPSVAGAASVIAGLPSTSQPQPVAPARAEPVGPTSQGPAPAAAAKPKPSAGPIATADRAPAAARPDSRREPQQLTQNRADPSKLAINRPPPGVNPKLEAGWAAYNHGEYEKARASYQDMLREEPTNRDALLGMAAVEVRANRLDVAETYYRALIFANPRDPYAQAGLMALKAQMGDPVQGESRVKSMIASDPDAQVLYFSLGNQYAQQGRWAEAQDAYFKAYSAEPENPDFAYNLAVSLDHVRQGKLALEYYRRAMSLSQTRSGSFDQALARSRIQELSR